jgi:hypothetical protein
MRYIPSNSPTRMGCSYRPPVRLIRILSMSYILRFCIAWTLFEKEKRFWNKETSDPICSIVFIFEYKQFTNKVLTFVDHLSKYLILALSYMNCCDYLLCYLLVSKHTYVRTTYVVRLLHVAQRPMCSTFWFPVWCWWEMMANLRGDAHRLVYMSWWVCPQKCSKVPTSSLFLLYQCGKQFCFTTFPLDMLSHHSLKRNVSITNELEPSNC